MGKINILDKHVAELIAAGEVVERPSSVIKELVENSIDAGATAITVEIKNGGISYMRVSDNGSGILKEDIRPAFIRHATSKVKYEEDLSKIGTLGFRGEALASISSVSHLELITKSKDEEIGTRYVVSGGEEQEFSDTGCPNGTTFIIRDLFYNVPARLKFLKSDVGEGNAISNVIDKIALSHPEISITYIKDSKQILKTSGDSQLLSAIYVVYGKDFASTLIPVDYSLNGVTVLGYVSKPEAARPNRNMQNFFLNGRYVISKTLMAAISEACKGYVMVGKYPSCVINVNVSLEVVDVNVHPTKLEVRFVNEKPIFDAVYHGVRSALLRGDVPKDVKLKQPQVNPFEMAKKAFREQEQASNSRKAVSTNAPKIDLEKYRVDKSPIVKDQIDPLSLYSKQAINKEVKKAEIIEERIENKKFVDVSEANIVAKTKEDNSIDSLIESDDIDFVYVGEAFKTYIIVEISKDELILIDKHAAHERIIFEQLKRDKGAGYEQMLLVPVTVTLNKIDYNSVISNLELFKNASFDVEDFGNGSVLVRSIPQYLSNEDIESTIEEMAGYLTEHKNQINSEKMEWIYHNVSCRAAIKAGNRSTELELKDLAKKVLSDDSLRHCPHGRPICISIKKRELEKNFGRV